MNTLGFVLVAIGLLMAWSGFSMEAQKKYYNKMLNQGKLTPVPREYGYHKTFRSFWWLPLVIGIAMIFIWQN